MSGYESIKLGDLLDPIKETYETLIPLLKDKDKRIISADDLRFDYRLLTFTSDFERKRKAIKSPLVESIIGEGKVRKMENLEKNIVEDIFWFFGEGIKKISLKENKKGYWPKYELWIKFCDGLTIESYRDPLEYSLRKYCEIKPSIHPQFLVRYEVTPSRIFFNLDSSYLKEMLFPDTFEEEMEIRNKLNKGCEKELVKYYKPLQTEMGKGVNGCGYFGIEVIHFPKPINPIEACIYLQPPIKEDTEDLKNVELYKVLYKLNEIEGRIREVYNKVDFSEIVAKQLEKVLSSYYEQ